MSIIHIETVDDERLADYRNVPDPELLARRGLFVAEGRLVVRRLLSESRLETRSLLLTPPGYASLEDVLAERSSLSVYVVPQEVMNGVAGFNFHRGCLAIGTRPRVHRWQELITRARRLVVLERVGNADNVGAIFRNAAAFGAEGILLQADCADPLYRKAIRTSMGASLTMPYAQANPWPQMLGELNAGGWATLALTPSAHAPLLRDVAATLARQRVALVVGHEGDGLTPEALAACTRRARIAMAHEVDSVNVATAGAIALYEMATGIG